MRSCIVGKEDYYHWGSPHFKLLFKEGVIGFPQVLVAEYPEKDKMLFEVEMDIDNLSVFMTVLPVLPGSVISGYDGRPASPLYVGAVVNTVDTRFVRLPNTKELAFYERYSNL